MSVFCMKEAEVYRKTLAGSLPHMEFVLDSYEEVFTLPTNTEAREVGGELVGPCAPGSFAFVPASSEIYMMDNNGGWHQMFS